MAVANQVELNERYIATEQIGAGHYGLVVKARDLQDDDEEVAVKVLLPSTYSHRYIEDELVHHSMLNEHPHIIRFKEVFLSSRNLLCLAMEYADGGTLYSLVRARGRLPEHTARRFFQQLILAISYCHARGIAIRDIKLENLLLATAVGEEENNGDDRWLVKLCDLGFSHASGSTAEPDMHSGVGTLAYMAPEVLQSKLHPQAYNGQAADMWSCGVVLFTMLYGCYPFNYDVLAAQLPDLSPDFMAALLTNMSHGNLHAPATVPLSDSAFTLLCRLLHPSPRARLTLPAVLRDPWFQEGLPEHYLEFISDPPLLQQGPVQAPADIHALILQARLLNLGL